MQINTVILNENTVALDYGGRNKEYGTFFIEIQDNNPALVLEIFKTGKRYKAFIKNLAEFITTVANTGQHELEEFLVNFYEQNET